MVVITIDIGNTAVKLGIFKEGALIEARFSENYNIFSQLKQYFPYRIVVCDVSGSGLKALKEHVNKSDLLEVNYKLKLPVTIRYLTPETLGSDRIAAVSGGWKKYGPSNLLIIDAGTCVTYDFIDKDGNYWGGRISPGIPIRFKALNNYTARLPVVEFSEEFNLFGNDTRSSILSGVIGGMITEINATIDDFRAIYPDIKIVICGGFSGFFETKLKQPIFVHPDLVLWGLWAISEYNEA